MDNVSARLAMAGIALAFISLGAALASDFKGFTTRHVRTTAKFMPMDEDKIEWQIRFERIILGGGFILGGLVFLFGAFDPRLSTS